MTLLLVEIKKSGHKGALTEIQMLPGDTVYEIKDFGPKDIGYYKAVMLDTRGGGEAHSSTARFKIDCNTV